MNRSNVGNIVTNGLQIGSVGMVTAAGVKKGIDQRKLDDATTSLNNVQSVDDIMKKNNEAAINNDTKDDINTTSSGTDNAIEDVETSNESFLLENGSEQSEEITKKINNNVSYTNKRNRRKVGSNRIRNGLSNLKPEDRKELNRYLKKLENRSDSSNANV